MAGRKISIVGLAGGRADIDVSQPGRDGATGTINGMVAVEEPTLSAMLATETPVDGLSGVALSDDNYTPPDGRTVATVGAEFSTDGSAWALDGTADLTAIERVYGRIIVTDDLGAETIFSLGSVQPLAAPDVLPALAGDGTPASGENVTLTFGTFIGANAAPVVHTLRRNGVTIATDPSSPYTLTDNDAGQTLTLRSTPNIGGAVTSDGLDIAALEGGEIATVHSGSALAQGVAELEPTLGGATITRMLSQPSRGWMTPRDDGKISYLLVTDTDRSSGSQTATFEVDRNGELETHQINVTIESFPSDQGRLPLSWPVFPTFYPEIDAVTGRAVFEPGPGHATIHTTLDSAAWWTRADIEAAESIGSASDSWLDSQDRSGDYYGSEAKPLEPSVAASWWHSRTYQKKSSTWLSFERGTNYDYEPFRPQGSWFPDSYGLNARHPIMVTSHGAGDLPKIGSMYPSNASGNCVYQDVEGTSYGHGRGQPRAHNVMWDGCFFPDFHTTGEPENITGITLRRCVWLDCWEPGTRADYGSGHSSRQNPFHPYETRGMVIEKCIMDVAGFQPGWNVTPGTGGVDPPENYSHTVYTDEDSDDTLFSEVLSSRGAFGGYNVRGGGILLHCMAFDCNVGLTHGKTGKLSNQCRMAVHRLVITSAGWRVYDWPANPSFAAGFIMSGAALAPTLDKVIVANYRDPAQGVEAVLYGPNPTGQPSYFLEKDAAGLDAAGYRAAIKSPSQINPVGTPGFTDYKVWNYPFNDAENVGGISSTVLNESTMQKWVEQQTGVPNQTTTSVAQYFRDTPSSYDLIKDAVDWFCTRFGYSATPSTPGTMYYRASSKSNGLRMDEPFNWSLDRPPMAGDTLHMNGHINVRPRRNIYCAELHMEGGQITVDGLIDVADAVHGPGSFTVEQNRVGDLRLPAYSSAEVLTIDVDGGRFLATGNISGAVDLTATGGETVLATPGLTYTVKAGSTLRAEGTDLNGNESGIGVDGDTGTATLTFEAGSTLYLAAAGDNALPNLRKFQSGRYGNADPACSFAVNCGSANLTLDVTGLAPGAYPAIEADSITGTFGTPSVIGGSATVSYTATTVTVNVS